MASLLEKAKKSNRRRLTPKDAGTLYERCQLAIAMAQGVVSPGQASAALGMKSSSNARTCLGTFLLTGIATGIVKAELVAK